MFTEAPPLKSSHVLLRVYYRCRFPLPQVSGGEAIPDLKMQNIDVEENLCERGSLDSASNVWLGQRNRDSIDSHPLHGAEQRRRQHGAVGPKYLICLTLGTGG